MKSPPPLKEYTFIPNTDPKWFNHVSEQRQLIKNYLISSYSLAFSDKNCDEVSYAAVSLIKISMNPGARPINRTTAVRCPYGLEVTCKAFLEKLNRQQIIRRWDLPTEWCNQARFILKSDGSPRLIINYKGLNAAPPVILDTSLVLPETYILIYQMGHIYL